MTTSPMIKLLGALLGVTFFAAIGMAMANATPAETHTAKAEITKTEKMYPSGGGHLSLNADFEIASLMVAR